MRQKDDNMRMVGGRSDLLFVLFGRLGRSPVFASCPVDIPASDRVAFVIPFVFLHCTEEGAGDAP